MKTKSIVGDIIFHREMASEMINPIDVEIPSSSKSLDLIPEEGYTTETRADGTKVLTCLNCNKSYSQVNSVKEPIKTIHDL